MVQFVPQGMALQLRCKTSDMLCYMCNKPLNLAICLRYMKTWNYNRTDIMPISYMIMMIRSAGAKYPPEYADRNLIVKHMWLSGSCRASVVVSVNSKTRLAQLIQS